MEHFFGYLELDIFKPKGCLIASQALINFILKGFCSTSKMSVRKKKIIFLKKNPPQPLAEHIIFNLGAGDSKISPK